MTEESNKPFRQTKKLIRLALDDGWTQKEIAAKARVQQSVVSGWATGKTKAKRHQIEFLLEEYGSQLRKLSSSIYSSQNYYYELTPELLSFFKSSDIDVQQFERKGRISSSEARKLLKEKSMHAQLQQLLDRFESLSDEVITQVEAPVIFKFVFQDEVTRGKQRKKFSVKRWILHSLGGQRFLLAIQSRRELTNQQRQEEITRRRNFQYPGCQWSSGGQNIEDIFISTCNDESCRWNTSLHEFRSIETIIQETDELLKDMRTSMFHNMQDVVTLPFLLKKALLDAGYAVKGVRKITAY